MPGPFGVSQAMYDFACAISYESCVRRCDTLRGMKHLLAMTFVAAALCAQDRPLASLPYTPSLEPAFIDRAVDPCVDFWRYSCGNWDQLNPIPPDQARWSVYGKLAQENLQFLWGVLEQAAKPAATRPANEQKIGDFFGACMDETAVEKAGAAPLQSRSE